MAQLKCDHKGLKDTRARAREAESAALLQQRLAYEDALHAAQQEAAGLAARLRDALERAAKVRQHADK